MQTERVVPAELQSVAGVSAEVRVACADAGLSPEAAIDLELAVVEAANNIILHGYGGGSGQVFTFFLRAVGDRVEVVLGDTGAPIPERLLESAIQPDADADDGRGLAIIRACVDKFDYQRSAAGNRLTLISRT